MSSGNQPPVCENQNVDRIAGQIACLSPEQSGYGIIADLEKCVQQLIATTDITPFTIGQYDASVMFEIPQKIYGRHKEIKRPAVEWISSPD